MAPEALQFWLINAFTTDTPHSGNQAGVVLIPKNDPRAEDDVYKQKIARDLNHSETSFLVPVSPGRWSLRWFTPEVEVVLCGHATLAASHVLFSLDPSLQDITFDTRFSGELRAKRIKDEKNGTTVGISLPSLGAKRLADLVNETEANTYKHRGEAAKVLGIAEKDVLRVSPFEYPPPAQIIQIAPGVDLAGLIVDAKGFNTFSRSMTLVTQVDEENCAQQKLAIKSRVFVEPLGIPEDPVTGSAHAYLTSFYLESPVKDSLPPILGLEKPEVVEVVARQVSARGGHLSCRLESEGRVGIVGTAVEIGKGTLSVW